MSPSTNAAALQRLRLAIGQEVAMRAAWVRSPDLAIIAVNPGYTRLAEHKYRYRNLDSGLTAVLELDPNGFPLKYQQLWQQRAKPGEAD